MVQERIQAALTHPANQEPSRRQALISAMEQFAKLGVVDPTTGKPVEPIGFPEQDLTVEWQRQTSRFLDLGYHTELGMSKEDYLASLPRFEAQPAEYAGRLDMLLLVETRIVWLRQAESAGIDVDPYLKENQDKTEPISPNSETPVKPYVGWFNKWGQRFVNKIAPSVAVEELREDEAGSGRLEGVTIQIHHPEFNQKGQYFDLIGENVGSGYVPYLRRWHGGPRLSAHWGDVARGYFRPLVRGSKIVTG